MKKKNTQRTNIKKKAVNINKIYFIALRQLVIVFDVKTTSGGNTYKPEGSLAVLQSTSSTYLHTNSSNIEVDKITV